MSVKEIVKRSLFLCLLLVSGCILFYLLAHPDSLNNPSKKSNPCVKSEIAFSPVKAVTYSNTADKNKRNEQKSSTARNRKGEKNDDSFGSSRRQQEDKNLIFFALALIATYLSSYFKNRVPQFSCRHLYSNRQYLLIRILRI
jgi:hypothetical protein